MKDIKRDIEAARLVDERSTTNFFVVMRPRLTQLNPIKYSNRQVLEKDLLVLASSCKHQIPHVSEDLEYIIDNHIKTT